MLEHPIVKRLWRENVRPHYKSLIIAGFFLIISGSATAANAWLLEPVLDEIFTGKNKDLLIILPIIVFIIAVVKGAATYGHNLILGIMGQKIVAKMQMRLFSYSIYADINWFDEQPNGRLISRFTNDINIFREALSHTITSLAKESVTLIFLVALMFVQNFQLALIAFFILPVAVWPVARIGRRMRKLTKQNQYELGGFVSQLDDSFAGIKVVKSYAQEEQEVSKAQKIISRLTELYIKAVRVGAITSPVMESLAGVAIAFVIWWGGMQVFEGTTTSGEFVSFIAALLLAYKPAKSLAKLNAAIQSGIAAAERLYEVLDRPYFIDDSKNVVTIKANDLKGDIVFDNLSFSYNLESEHSNKPVLDNLSLEIPSGRMAALVGPSGGGKSTIMQMIMRFYQQNNDDKGRILLDGVDIRELSIKFLRENIAYVPQDAFLFDTTIAENIAYGREDLLSNLDSPEVMAKIKDAAQHAYAHDFIEKMPNGYLSNVGQGGGRLSGGQRQRIAIARAFLYDAPILLLDEPTSALDSESEKYIQKALAELMTGRTTLVIAHRLSTIMGADSIFVIKDGKVVQSGTHNQLITDENGEYRNLYKSWIDNN